MSVAASGDAGTAFLRAEGAAFLATFFNTGAACFTKPPIPLSAWTLFAVRRTIAGTALMADRVVLFFAGDDVFVDVPAASLVAAPGLRAAFAVRLGPSALMVPLCCVGAGSPVPFSRAHRALCASRIFLRVAALNLRRFGGASG